MSSRNQQIDYTMRYQIRSGRVNFANYVQRRQLLQEGRVLGLNVYPPDQDASMVPTLEDGAVNTTPAEYAEYISQVAPLITVPGAPTSLVATPGNGEATISFTAPSDGGSPITNYEYWITDASGGDFTAFSPAVTTSPVTVTDLPNGMTLHIRLRAVNAIGPGAQSDIVEVTPVGPPETPYGLTATPGNAQISVTFSQGSDGGSAITNYQYSTDNGATFRAFSPADTASPVVITKLSTNGVTNLTNGVSYTIRLKAVTAIGVSDASDSVSATPSTTPSPPTGLSGTAGDKQIEVSFTAGSNGGSAITNYQYSTDNGATFRAFSPADDSSPVTITKLSSDGTTDLTNDIAYTVRLKAVNANGASIQSSSISVTPILITAPPAPISLSGVGGYQAIYVLFTQSGNGGSAITNYEYSTDDGATFIAFSPAQTFSPVAITTLSSDGTTALTNGNAYTVKLKAVNSVGASIDPSDSVSVTTTTNTLNTTNLLVELDANNASSYSGSGSTWTNLRSSGSYSATLLNAPIFDGTDKYFTFDGTDQIAEIAAAAAINPTIGSSFTLQIWARVNTASPNFGSGDGLISKQLGSPSYDGYSLSLNTNTSLYLKMNGGSVDGTYSSSTGVYSNGWALYTIVVRFGGGSGSPSYTYVSTRRVVTGDNSESSIPSQGPIQFPRGIQESTFNFCPADIGAFYLYNTAVSQEDIIRNYDATKSRYGL
jgi:hypothetical protein